MTLENERLPIERPLPMAIRIYARRIGVFLLIVLANLFLLGLLVVLQVPMQ